MTYRISEFAVKCGVKKETIRFYEKKHLVSPVEYSQSGYRLYSPESVKRVRFIKQLQNLGFSLNEIHKLLGVVDRDEVRCSDMYNFVSRKSFDVQKQITELQKVQKMLEKLKACCPNEENLFSCPIIETLFES
ncbi:Hg(II)-responsive transcriptional regulator [Neobacillus sp. SM06]|uniref:Hg(II)-responsive transcriptional regulator n=1 Tax=Neobacillus sp. SM06 TaxID=3422492 RepID=UPI003D2C521B